MSGKNKKFDSTTPWEFVVHKIDSLSDKWRPHYIDSDGKLCPMDGYWDLLKAGKKKAQEDK